MGEHPFRFELRPTPRTERRTCPVCKSFDQLTVMEPEARSPLGMKYETIFRCPRCERLSIPAGVVKRLGGLVLVTPFLLMITSALATSAWIMWTMIVSGAVDAGYALIALVLAGAAVLSGRPALRSLARLLRPGALLPLARHAEGVHDFSGEL